MPLLKSLQDSLIARTQRQQAAPICLRLLLSRFRPGARDLHQATLYLLLGLLLISLAMAAILQLPQVPYNIRELFGEKDLIVSLPLFAFFLLWTAGMPNIMARITIICPSLHLAQPIMFLMLAVPAWWLLKLAVSTESLVDLLGAPVLGWPGDWELFSRALALSAPFLLSLFYWNLMLEGSTWVNRRFGFGQFLGALLLGLPFLWLSKYVVVDQAAGNNLLWLSAQGPFWLVGSHLAAAMALITLNGVLLAWVRVWSGRYQALIALATPLSLITAWWLINQGLSDRGLSFLLSPDLKHQAGQLELFIRWAIVYSASIGLIAFAHLIPFRLRGPAAFQRQSLKSGTLHTALSTTTPALISNAVEQQNATG